MTTGIMDPIKRAEAELEALMGGKKADAAIPDNGQGAGNPGVEPAPGGNPDDPGKQPVNNEPAHQPNAEPPKTEDANYWRQRFEAMQGYNAMGIDPTSANTFEMFGGTTYDKLRSALGYSNPAQSSYLSQAARLIANGQADVDGPYADSISRGIESANRRDMTNQWLDEIASGKTTDSFQDWSGVTGQARVDANYEGIDGKDDDGTGAASSNPGTNDGTHNAGGDERY